MRGEECAYAPTIPSYNQKIEVLKECSPAVVDNFLKDLHPSHWANAYFIPSYQLVEQTKKTLQKPPTQHGYYSLFICHREICRKKLRRYKSCLTFSCPSPRNPICCNPEYLSKLVTTILFMN
ncbi:hypothetical protein LOK49_LG07G01697 [Camellia lanceoleosa]|uniref:Uncharacterized protein n=1 Tax=Camellia lanceoleosa TaxID=1840588 RepID=A0ACC0H3F6_9ERIC|nr:hypothetical protein LOK49_LG07G01697 [Camellia lanceoleosa]